MAKVFSNTYIEPGATTTLSTSRQQYNSSLRSLLTNFKSKALPTFTNITIAGETIGEQDGMLYRSDETGALYISDSLYKKNTPIGGNFTRVGIGARVEESVDALAANATSYEIGELVSIVSQNPTLAANSTLYLCTSNATTAGSLDGFLDLGNLDDSKFIRISADSQIFSFNSAGEPDPLLQSIEITAGIFNITEPVTFSSEPTVTLSGSGNSRTLTVADFGSRDRVTITATAGAYSDSITIIRVQSGSDTVNAILTNEAHTVVAENDGSSPQLLGAETEMLIFVGATNDTENWEFSRVNSAGIESTILDNHVQIDSMTVDEGYVDITASKASYSDITKRFTLSKSRKGDTGQDAVQLDIIPSAITLPASYDGVVDSYENSSSEVRVFQGGTELNYTLTTPTVNGTWFIDSVDILTNGSLSSDIVVGTITDEGLYAGVAAYSAMDNDVDSVVARFNIVAKLLDGTTVSRSIRQVISKSKAGFDGSSAKAIAVSATGQTFTYNGDGIADPSSQTITLTATLQNTNDTVATWSTSPTVALGGSGNTRTLSIASFGSNSSVIITVTADSGIVQDRITIYRLQDGADGDDGDNGQNAITALLTNEAHTVPADNDGSNPVLTGAVTDMRIYEGVSNVTSSWSFTRSNSTGITSSISGNRVTVTGMTVDTGYIDIVANRSGYSAITKRFTLSKSKVGSTGSTGNTVVTGTVYYQILTNSTPSTPTATGYNSSTGQLIGLTTNWSDLPPQISLTSLNQAWTSEFTLTLSPTGTLLTKYFTPPVGSIQVTTNIASDNFNGLINSSGSFISYGTIGWAITRNGGKAVFNDVRIRGSMSVGTTSQGIFVNDPSIGSNAAYIYQNSNLIYGLFVKNSYDPGFTEGAGGAALFESRGGYTVEVRNTENNLSTGDAALFAQNSAPGAEGGAVWLGESKLDSGYGVNVLRGGYYDSSGDGYLPFTGSHEAMIAKTSTLVPGDIVCDVRVIAKNISDSFTEVTVSDAPCIKSVVGVYKGMRKGGWEGIAAFMDKEATTASSLQSPYSEDGTKATRDKIKVYSTDWSEYTADYVPIIMHSVGEGCINVCGEGGNISKGDLLVSSSIPGKGMKQLDDVVRNYTVAKAREDVIFNDPSETIMIACIYMCG